VGAALDARSDVRRRQTPGRPHRTGRSRLLAHSPATPATCPVAENLQTMNTNTSIPDIDPDKIMDVRPIPCSVKHGQILQRWRELPLGDHFVLVNDHDPVPLHYQFKAEFPEQFTWEHLLRGDDEFRVKITRVAA
jgi:uncharacterized protein (DUF2249 family)